MMLAVISLSVEITPCTFGLCGRHLRFPTPAHFVLPTYIVPNGTLAMQGHENMAFALGILLVSGLQHHIHVIPVLAAAIIHQQNLKKN